MDANRRVIEPATGRKGSWVSVDQLSRRYVLVRWDDGAVDEAAIGDLLPLTQARLDRFLARDGRIAGHPPGESLNLGDVDPQAASCEAAIGNPVLSS